MKTVTYTAGATGALLKHRNEARRIRAKIDDYAADPLARATWATPLAGRPGKRLRIGEFRAIFEENETTIIILRIAPRGSVHD